MDACEGLAIPPGWVDFVEDLSRTGGNILDSQKCESNFVCIFLGPGPRPRPQNDCKGWASWSRALSHFGARAQTYATNTKYIRKSYDLAYAHDLHI